MPPRALGIIGVIRVPVVVAHGVWRRVRHRQPNLAARDELESLRISELRGGTRPVEHAFAADPAGNEPPLRPADRGAPAVEVTHQVNRLVARVDVSDPGDADYKDNLALVIDEIAAFKTE